MMSVVATLLYWLCLFLHCDFTRKTTSTHSKQFAKLLECPNKQFELLVFLGSHACHLLFSLTV